MRLSPLVLIGALAGGVLAGAVLAETPDPTAPGAVPTREETAAAPAVPEPVVVPATPVAPAAVEQANAAPTPLPVPLGVEPPAPAKVDEGPVAAPQAAADAQPAAPPPAFALDTELTERMARDAAKLAGPAREERRALAAFYANRQMVPAWVDEAGFTDRARRLMKSIARADEFGLEASAFRLPRLSASPSRADLADADVTLSTAALAYARHARGGRTDPAGLTKFLDRRPQLLDAGSVIAELAKAGKPGTYLESLNPRHPQFEKLRQAYLAARAGIGAPAAPVAEEPVRGGGRGRQAERRGQRAPEPPSSAALARKLLVNMEQWRWMPSNLGNLNVWVNIPEYTLRVMKAGKPIHTERIVAGKVDAQTPIFSEDMREVIFHPFWGVPDGIKRNELQPALARGYPILAKNGLRIQSGGRDIDPGSVDWSTADIRRFHVYQPPGGTNVLGVVKFRFPNKHDVYMHDTPSKSLFNEQVRAYSHGCMRVRDPVKLAEILLGEDRGMAADQVRAMAAGGPANNQVNLAKRVPVHITYFTAWVEDDGKVRTFADIYGHDTRIALGLEGKQHLIVQPKEPGPAAPIGRMAESQWNGGGGYKKDWMKSIFGF